MTPADLARLTEEERALFERSKDDRGLIVGSEVRLLLVSLALARAVVEAASRWDHWGKVKVMHVLTCKECERLEVAEARWCAEASKIARTQLDAGKALQAALAAHDAETGR